jgi:tetratricopeptide (TPR) repeat protein
VFFLKSGISYFLRQGQKNHFSAVSFLVACYLWISVTLFLPTHVTFILAVLFSGVFLGSLLSSEQERGWKISFLKISKSSVILSVVFILILAVNVSISFSVYKRVFSVADFQRGILYAGGNEFGKAADEFQKAVKLSPVDIYKRSLAEVQVLELGKQAASTSDPSPSQIRHLQNLIDESLNNAELAIAWNPRGIENWLTLARVYEILAGLGVAGAGEKVSETYAIAQSFDPFNPLPNFLLARFEVSLNNLSDAEEHVGDALSKKPNYGEAMLLYSQIKSRKGELEEAITSAVTSIGLRPGDPIAYFQLGLLYLEEEDYKNAEENLKEALLLEPLFADARYFLALALVKTGQQEEAIRHFEKLSADFPDNKNVESMIDSLKGEN